MASLGFSPGLAKCDLLTEKVPMDWENMACRRSCPPPAEGTFHVNCDVRSLVMSEYVGRSLIVTTLLRVGA